MYWRMQLHPNEPEEAMKYTVQSLVAGYIGLDFSTDVGDLNRTPKNELPDTQKNYWAFAHEMQAGDEVLIFVHNFPFALCTVSGEYNYIRTPDEKLGVWFRHFRRVENVRYYGDYEKSVPQWESIPMTTTITPLNKPDSASYRLIEEWLGHVPA